MPLSEKNIENREVLNAIISKAIEKPVVFSLPKKNAIRLRTLLYLQRSWLRNKYPDLDLGFEVILTQQANNYVELVIQPQFYDLEFDIVTQDKDILEKIQTLRKQKQSMIQQTLAGLVPVDYSNKDKTGAVGLVPEENLKAKELSLDELTNNATESLVRQKFGESYEKENTSSTTSG